MLILIRGAGDIATGIALRLWHSGFPVVLTDQHHPTAIRRTVAFSEAIREGSWTVEGVESRCANSAQEALNLLDKGIVPVLADPLCACLSELKPAVLVDAILAKKNLGTHLRMASCVIAVGPGFTAGEDCHAVVETMRGHTLGRVYYHGSTLPNTGIPGLIGGFSGERVLRAPAPGIFTPHHSIGDAVIEGDLIASVDGVSMLATLTGTLRGILPSGTPVFQGMKAGDIDPRCDHQHCFTVSDKALAVGGGVLEAVMHLTQRTKR